MKFKYEAKTKDGEDQAGYVEAGSRDAAINILAGHELFILKLESVSEGHWFDRLGNYFAGVKVEDLMIFTRQLSTLLEARLSLNRALNTLREQTTNPMLKEAAAQIAQDVDSGLAFSQALERQNAIFSSFYISIIQSAEVTGNLDRVTGFLADYLEREMVIRRKARSALTYPIIILILFFLVALLLITVVFPQIKTIFEESGVELPLISKIFIVGGTFVLDWWFVFFVIMIVLGLFGLDYIQTPEGQAFLDDAKIRMPVLKKIFIPLTLTRFANATTMLIKGGVPVAQALEIVGETVDNVLYRDAIREAANDVRQGVALSDSLTKRPELFPVLIPQMITVGEAAGQLDQILARISAFYDREADSIINNLVDLIQPIVMIGLGLMIGVLFGAVLIPLYRLTGSIQ